MNREEQGQFVSSGAWGDAIVREDLAAITEAFGAYDDIDAVVLEGSFGRGEGAVCSIGGLPRAVNDYDIAVVTRHEVSDAERLLDKSKLLGQLSVGRIDIAYVARRTLRTLKPTLQNFDRKYGSTVISGNQQIFEEIPSWCSSAIPAREAEKLLFTRLTGFLLAAGIPERSTSENSFLWRQQLAKAGVAVADAQLILEGRYMSSNRQKELMVESLAPFTLEERALIADDFEFKIRPGPVEVLDPEDLRARLELYIRQFQRCGRAMYGRRFDSVSAYDRCYLRSWRPLLIRGFQRLIGDRTMAPSQYLNLSQLFFVLAMRSSGEARDRLHETSLRYLKRAGANAACRSEGSLRDAILRLRLNE